MKFNEVRKNPELNPKVSVNQQIIDQLKSSSKINDMANLWVHFTSINKLGINTQSPFDTPLAVCAYPAEYVIDLTGLDKPMSELPFAGGRKYAITFSVKTALDIDNMSESDLENYIQQLTPIVDKLGISENYLAYIVDQSFKFAIHRKLPGGRFWYILYSISELTKNPKVQWNKIFQKLNIPAVYSKIGILHSNEPQQIMVFDPQVITNVTTVLNRYSPKKLDQSKKIYSEIQRIRELSHTMDPEDFYIYFANRQALKFINDPTIIDKFTLATNPQVFPVETWLMQTSFKYWTKENFHTLIKHDPTTWLNIPKNYQNLNTFLLALKYGNADQRSELILGYQQQKNNPEINDFVNGIIQNYKKFIQLKTIDDPSKLL